MASEIYALKLGDDVRYVGCSTKGAAERWRQHQNQARCMGTTPLEKWILANASAIEVVVLETVEDTPRKDGYGKPLQGPGLAARDAERGWVTHFLFRGAELFNRSPAELRDALRQLAERERIWATLA